MTLSGQSPAKMSWARGYPSGLPFMLDNHVNDGILSNIKRTANKSSDEHLLTVLACVHIKVAIPLYIITTRKKKNVPANYILFFFLRMAFLLISIPENCSNSAISRFLLFETAECVSRFNAAAISFCFFPWNPIMSRS